MPALHPPPQRFHPTHRHPTFLNTVTNDRTTTRCAAATAARARCQSEQPGDDDSPHTPQPTCFAVAPTHAADGTTTHGHTQHAERNAARSRPGGGSGDGRSTTATRRRRRCGGTRPAHPHCRGGVGLARAAAAAPAAALALVSPVGACPRSAAALQPGTRHTRVRRARRLQLAAARRRARRHHRGSSPHPAASECYSEPQPPRQC
jgi:hypothetical protein